MRYVIALLVLLGALAMLGLGTVHTAAHLMSNMHDSRYID
jgi:hypothetical protein